VIHVNFIRPFISREGFAWTQKGEAMQRELHARGADAEAIKKATAEWEKSSGPSATIADVADHIDHIRKVAGIDAIGIGADFYDVKDETMVTGLGNVTRYPFLFAELLRRGYSDEDVMKIAGRNHLRAMRRMEKVAAELQRTETPLITEPKLS
jgi:membrane dipeptidase